MLLQEAETMRYVWTERFAPQARTPYYPVLRDEVASTVAHVSHSPSASSSAALDDEGGPSENLDGYRAVLDFYQYTRSFRQDMIEPTPQARTGDRTGPDLRRGLCLPVAASHRLFPRSFQGTRPRRAEASSARWSLRAGRCSSPRTRAMPIMPGASVLVLGGQGPGPRSLRDCNLAQPGRHGSHVGQGCGVACSWNGNAASR